MCRNKGDHKLLQVNSPQQTNGYDCGVYVLMVTEQITKFLLKDIRDLLVDGILTFELDYLESIVQHVLESIEPSGATLYRKYMVASIKSIKSYS